MLSAMKNILVFLAVCLLSSTTFAQTTPVQEPEFANVFAALAGTSLTPLERQTSSFHAGGGGFMVATAKAAYEIPGNRSPIRFQTANLPSFVVRSPFAGTGTDPNSFFLLRRLTAKKKTREAQFMSGHFTPFGGSTNTDLNAGRVPVEYSRYGENSLKLSVGQLAPGEYALSVAGSQDLFCFGID
jgi:hypothetical protein